MAGLKEFKGVEVQVSRLDTQARGCAKWEYQEKIYDLHLPYTLPQEELVVDIIKKKRKPPLAFLQSVKKASTERQVPRCEHFTNCGGCSLQHLQYESQSTWKQEGIKKAFKHAGVYPGEWKPFIASDSIWACRNKMSFSFGQDKEGQRYLGLNLKGKSRVQNVPNCQLVPSWMRDVLKEVKAWWEEGTLAAYNFRNNTGTLRELTLREGTRTQDRLIMLTLSSNPEFAPDKACLEAFDQRMQALHKLSGAKGNLSVFLCLYQVMKGHATQIYELHLSGPTYITERLYLDDEQKQALDFQISPQAFFQTHTQQAERLYQAALKPLESKDLEAVYDLYCGTGVIGSLIARKGAKQVFSVELKKEAVLDGEENIKLNGITNQEFIWGDVQQVMQSDQLRSKPSLIVVDPPRAGLGEKVVKHLLQYHAPKILYISCNPESQAKDLAMLSSKYEVEACQGVDQFPQTHHVENIAWLKRK